MNTQYCLDIFKGQGEKNCPWMDNQLLVGGIEKWKADDGQNYIGCNIQSCKDWKCVILNDFMVDGSKVCGE